MPHKLNEFPVCIYGELQQISPVISKARCRIFYKYANRNGTYITDEFADKLIASLPYTPVKGIYDQFEQDYADHGASNEYGRIYGIVPENPNFAWEKHIDEDGVERTYACADVLIFSALYEEAAQIVGKAQSMELYRPSIKGDWAYINGQKMFKFEDGCFIGLQILGEHIEPCFEGAAFFTLYDELKKIVGKLEQYSLDLEQGGQSEMTKINFKLSDSQKFDMLWSLVNTQYNEEGGWMITYAICDVYDDYALAYEYETGDYYRIYYQKDDSTDSLEITETVKCYILDITEDEKNALEALRAFNGGSFNKINDEFTILNSKNEELNNQIATLTTERDEASAQYEVAKESAESLTFQIDELTKNANDLAEELNTLKNFKAAVETREKEAIIASYADMLSEDILDSYREKISEYACALDLDKDLAYELKKNNSAVFEKTPQYIYHNDDLGGVEAILTKYKK